MKSFQWAVWRAISFKDIFMEEHVKRLILIPFLIIFISMEAEIMAQQNAQPEAGVSGEARYINGSIGRLYALLQLPDLPPDGKCPMVILCHGFRGSLEYHLWAPLAEILNAHGIGVLRFDFGGCGKSDGQFEDMTVPGEIDDLMNVISYVRALPTTSTITLVGHSQGGVVCGMAAGQCGESQIKALALMSAAAVLREDALRGNTMGVKYDPWHLDQPYYELPGGEKLGRDYIRSAMSLPIYETTAKYKGPAFILNGMADQVVPYTYAQRYKQILPQGKLVIIPGENHTCDIHPDYVVSLVAEWLLQTLL